MLLPIRAALLRRYSTNVLRLTDPDDWEEKAFTLRPGRPTGLCWAPLHLIPAWNPDGAPTPTGRNIALREGLESAVLAAAGAFTVGAAYASDLTWAEEVLAVRGLDDATAARIAAEHRQPVCWRTDGHRLHVLQAGNGRVLGGTRVETSRLETRTCVMPRHQPDSAEPCQRPGAPHTTRSREVAAFFTRDRADLLAILGCDTCADGQRPQYVDRPILMHEWSVASRYAPPQIIRQRTEDELI